MRRRPSALAVYQREESCCETRFLDHLIIRIIYKLDSVSGDINLALQLRRLCAYRYVYSLQPRMHMSLSECVYTFLSSSLGTIVQCDVTRVPAPIAECLIAAGNPLGDPWGVSYLPKAGTRALTRPRRPMPRDGTIFARKSIEIYPTPPGVRIPTLHSPPSTPWIGPRSQVLELFMTPGGVVLAA